MKEGLDKVSVTDNANESRFECSIDGITAVAEYDLEPGRIVFTHTEVPEQLSGRGVAGHLVGSALEQVKQRNLKVVPQCSYVAAYIERHPEYSELVDKDR